MPNLLLVICLELFKKFSVVGGWWVFGGWGVVVVDTTVNIVYSVQCTVYSVQCPVLIIADISDIAAIISGDISLITLSIRNYFTAFFIVPVHCTGEGVLPPIVVKTRVVATGSPRDLVFRSTNFSENF